MKPFEELFPADPEARIMMRWWWFGPTMTRPEIDRELGLMKGLGIGGVEIAFVYPVTLKSETAPALYSFLSQQFMETLGYAAASARRLGLILDVTLGSGWPYGGPHVTASLQARQLRIRDVLLPAGTLDYELADGGGAAIIAAVLGNTPVAFTGMRLTLAEALPEPACLRVLLAVPTNQMVKRAAYGAEGFVLDHYCEDALAAHLTAVGDPIVQAVGTQARAIFCDSLEVYHSNWSGDYLAAFTRLRGYDLRPHLPALLAAMDLTPGGGVALPADIDVADCILDLLHDYALTLQELFEQAFLQPLRRFANRHGLACRVQVYGIPPTSLSSYRHVDIPEGESTLGDSTICLPADWTELTPNRFAASAGKHYGHRIISGETWTRLHSPPYAATLLDMKAEADQFFLQGTNQIIGHGWCQKPEDGDPSQWVFYAAANFNEANPWHPILPVLTRYLQRICALMRQGRTVADVALYLPDHDVMARRTFSGEKANLHHVNGLRDHIGTALPRALLAMGYNFDLVDDRVLQETARDHSLKQAVILLPAVTRMPLQTLKALQTHHDDGVWLLALDTLPCLAPGYRQRHESAQVARLATAIFTSGACRHAMFQRALDIAELARRVPPDIGLEQDAPHVGYVHRKRNGSDLYFFVNTSNRPIAFTPRFRDAHHPMQWLNAITGDLTGTGLGPVRLEPYESVVAVCRPRTATHADVGSGYATAAARTPSREIVLDQPWTLDIPSRGFRQALDHLRPWTDFEAQRHFSGQAIYACDFHCAADVLTGARACLVFDDPLPIAPHTRQPERRNTGFSVFLDPPIWDAAEVVLNGEHVGSLFAPPYRLDLGHALVPGENRLELTVCNRLINDLSKRSLHDFSSIHALYGNRFGDIQDFDNLRPAPAGIRGRVKLQFFDET